MPVLNQAVLLRGVNDNVEALADLCEQLVDLRAMPYYLHNSIAWRARLTLKCPRPRGCD